jgi:hypothetical protein
MVKNPRHALPDEGEKGTVVIPVTVESLRASTPASTEHCSPWLMP